MYWFYSWVTYIIILPGIILSLLTGLKVKATFKKYSRVQSVNGYTADGAARKLLHENGCYGVDVQPINGNLTDNYNPQTHVVSLSQNVFNNDSVAAIGVAAHECGHAVQDNEEYFPLKLRKVLVPITNFGTRIAIPLCIFGILLEYLSTKGNAFSEFFIFTGILCYGLSTVFALITLPVEINASRRATKMLVASGIVDKREKRQIRKVLSAAALTYFASLIVSLLYFIRFLVILAQFRRK